jgi:hypothetical protein
VEFLQCTNDPQCDAILTRWIKSVSSRLEPDCRLDLVDSLSSASKEPHHAEVTGNLKAYLKCSEGQAGCKVAAETEARSHIIPAILGWFPGSQRIFNMQEASDTFGLHTSYLKRFRKKFEAPGQSSFTVNPLSLRPSVLIRDFLSEVPEQTDAKSPPIHLSTPREVKFQQAMKASVRKERNDKIPFDILKIVEDFWLGKEGAHVVSSPCKKDVVIWINIDGVEMQVYISWHHIISLRSVLSLMLHSMQVNMRISTSLHYISIDPDVSTCSV